MSAASDSTRAVIGAATETPTGIVLAANLAPAQTMTAVFANMNEQNKAVLFVKTSDTRLSGGESHLRVKKMSAASDRTRAVIGASVEIAILAVILASAQPMWTTVNELATSIRAKINTPNNPILGVKSSDTSL